MMKVLVLRGPGALQARRLNDDTPPRILSQVLVLHIAQNTHSTFKCHILVS